MGKLHHRLVTLPTEHIGHSPCRIRLELLVLEFQCQFLCHSPHSVLDDTYIVLYLLIRPVALLFEEFKEVHLLCRLVETAITEYYTQR